VTQRKTNQTATPDTPVSHGDDATPEQDGASAAKEQGAEPKPSAKKGGKAIKRNVLKVRALGERFRRAGLSFGPRETVLDVDTLTDEQLAALKAEPRLAVVEDQVDVQADAGAKE